MMRFENRVTSAWPVRLVAVLPLVALAGCGGGATRSDDGVDFAKVAQMTGFYEAYLGDHRRQAPKDESAFREYLNSNQENLRRVGLSVDDMFVSPRGRGPLAWVYGKRPPTNQMGVMIVAYETTPTDGKRLVMGTRGMYEDMDETQFRRLFPNVE